MLVNFISLPFVRSYGQGGSYLMLLRELLLTVNWRQPCCNILHSIRVLLYKNEARLYGQGFTHWVLHMCLFGTRHTALVTIDVEDHFHLHASDLLVRLDDSTVTRLAKCNYHSYRSYFWESTRRKGENNAVFKPRI
jgi:hypothetical protein